jgi:DNA/RNA endonuclease G (NUC1)
MTRYRSKLTSKTKSVSKIKITKRATKNKTKTIFNMDNLTYYSRIFSKRYRSNHPSNTILFLKKKEYDIFYSTKYKYPLLVVETINSMTGKTDPNEAIIDRRLIEDPFRLDLNIPEKYQYTPDDYKKYMEYGGSLGHNAAAGQHKTNLEIYYETFQMSNITPQEMVFNSGLWVLMEIWCKNLNRNNKLAKIMVMTGSIPSYRDKNLNGFIMNVPEKMFKIVCLQLENRPDMTAMEIFLGLNKPFYINYTLPRFDLSPFLLSHSSIKKFQNESGINISNLLDYYGFNSSRIKPFRDHLNLEINITPILKLQLRKNKWFGKIIYSKTLDILENNWTECQKFANDFDSIRYHQEYYELTKKRLLRENNILSGTTPIDYSASKKQVINKQLSKKLSGKKLSKVLSKKL